MLEVALIVSIAGQALLLFHGPWTLTMAAGAFSLSLLAAILWNGRDLLPPHVDMVLLMAGLGGLGMAVATPKRPLCHEMSLAEWGLMVAGMFLLSLPATWRYARCFQIAKSQGQQWTYLLLHSLGMLAGMYGGMVAFHRLPTPAPSQLPFLHHLFMLIGMLLAMPTPRVVAAVHEVIHPAWRTGPQH